MKYIIILLLSISTFAQDSLNDKATVPTYNKTVKLAVVAVKGTNIVYRGIDNPINVAVTGAEGWNTMVKVSAGSFKKISGTGEYSWNVTSASESSATVTISYTLSNGEKRIEEKEFEIRPIPPIITLINGRGCRTCILELTKKQVIDMSVGMGLENINLTHIKPVVSRFEIKFFKKGDTYIVSGNTLSEEMKKKAQKLKPGDIIYISGAQTETSDLVSAYPIKILIVDEPKPAKE